MKKTIYLSAALLAAALPLRAADDFNLTVQAGQPGAKINPAMWGIFFEDINLGADGGLYAELLKNRSFEFTNAMMGWSAPSSGAGKTEIRSDLPFSEANVHYLRVECDGSAAFGVSNEGFRGIGLKAGDVY